MMGVNIRTKFQVFQHTQNLSTEYVSVHGWLVHSSMSGGLCFDQDVCSAHPNDHTNNKQENDDNNEREQRDGEDEDQAHFRARISR